MSPEDVFKSVGFVPILSAYQTTGFHGTNEQIAASICVEGFSLGLCKLGLYGRGIYFFEDKAPHPGKEMALNFVRVHRADFSSPAVVQSDITLRDAFDLIDCPLNLQYFLQIQRILVAELTEKFPDYSPDDRAVGTATISYLQKYCPKSGKMDGTRVSVKVKKNFDPPNQNTVCVYKTPCIVNNRQC